MLYGIVKLRQKMTKFRQDEQSVLTDFGPADTLAQPMILQRESHHQETPWHKHKKGQLILALQGTVTSYVEQGMWLVPPKCAVWIPSQQVHRNAFAPNSDVCMVFIDVAVTRLPDSVCTLALTPLMRELILHIATLPIKHEPGSQAERMVQVLMELLEQAPQESFDFPIPEEPRLRDLARRLLNQPDDRRTLAQWAQDYAMSERTLARLIRQHVQLTFGQWRARLHTVLALEKLAQQRPIQRISDELGYESVGAFITFFKKQFGCTPKQYQRQRWQH